MAFNLIMLVVISGEEECLSSVPRRSVLMCSQVEVERARVEKLETNLVEANLLACVATWRERDILLQCNSRRFQQAAFEDKQGSGDP